MSKVLESTPGKELAESITPEELESATRTLTVSDAMRLGSTVTTQTKGWGTDTTACALASARIGASVAKYCD